MRTLLRALLRLTPPRQRRRPPPVTELRTLDELDAWTDRLGR